MTQAKTADDAILHEKSIIRCIIEKPDLIARVDYDLAEDFFSSDHRALCRAAVKLHGEGAIVDPPLLITTSGVDPAVVSDLYATGALTDNFDKHVAGVQAAARERRFKRLAEELPQSSPEERLRILEQIHELSQGVSSGDWRPMFHTREEFTSAPPQRFAIDRFLQEGGTTFIAALPGHSKTLVMLEMARALLTGDKLFGYFDVPQVSTRVLYLIPESTPGPFWSRVKLFRLEDYVDDRLFIRTLTARAMELTDSRMLKAVEGADVFLDTSDVR